MKKKSMLIVAIILMSIGFAAVSTTLIINGNAKVSENEEDFSVIFTAASIDGKDVYATVVDDTKKIITFETSELKTLNQTSVLTYEVTNNSSNYDAEVKVTCVPKEGTTAKYTSIKNKLDNDATKVLAKESINGTLTITLDKTSTEEISEEYKCKLEFNAVERDTLGNNTSLTSSFESDSWSTIAANIKSGNTSNYKVGDTKKITIASHTNDCSSSTGYGSSYICNSSVESEKETTVRVANMSTCTNGEKSETACGFVLEFEDIIETHNFNNADAISQYGTNEGGWEDSKIRKYMNAEFYNALPSDLQDIIISTEVISGYGGNESNNFETQDKIYLLSSEEIFSDFSSSSNAQYDTSVGTSKQLDYYKNHGVTTSNYDAAIKKFNGNNSMWWLRSAYASNTNHFTSVRSYGAWYSGHAHYAYGVSPAFRIL